MVRVRSKYEKTNFYLLKFFNTVKQLSHEGAFGAVVLSLDPQDSKKDHPGLIIQTRVLESYSKCLVQPQHVRIIKDI